MFWRQYFFLLRPFVQGDAQVIAETRPPIDKWPRIAVLVGGSITVASARDCELQASDPIKFVKDGSKEVEGIPGLMIAVPQKWEPKDQFNEVNVDEGDQDELIIVSNSDGALKYIQKQNHVKIAAICLDIDAKKEMRLLIK